MADTKFITKYDAGERHSYENKITGELHGILTGCAGNWGVTGEGTMWTSALNGGRWKVEGEVNTIKETVELRGNFTI